MESRYRKRYVALHERCHADPVANQEGDSSAAELLPLVYDELRKLADAKMAAERGDHTLQGTALVHGRLKINDMMKPTRRNTSTRLRSILRFKSAPLLDLA